MSDATNQSNSNGLTPASSNTNQSGTNSTYSPPQVEDDDSGIQGNQPRNQSSFSSNAPSRLPTFPGAQTLNNNTAKLSGNMSTGFSQSDPFKIAAGWDSNAGTTPGFSGTSPGGEWENLMQDGGWEKMMQDGTWFDQNQTTMSPK